MGLWTFIFFFRHDFVRAISLEPLLAETPNSVCCLVLRSNFALLLTIQFASLLLFLFFSRHNFFWGGGARFFFFFFFFFAKIFFYFIIFLFSATILSGSFASLISSLINIISLLLTTFGWTKVRGIAPRSHTGRPRTGLVIIIFFSLSF